MILALHFTAAVSLAGQNSTDLAKLGFASLAKGENQKALDYYSQALALSRASGKRLIEGVILNNIGVAYGHLGELKKALDYFGQALPILRAAGNRSLEANTLLSIGTLYMLWARKRRRWIITARRFGFTAPSATARAKPRYWNILPLYTPNSARNRRRWTALARRHCFTAPGAIEPSKAPRC